ncbi:MAG: hypothetical protein A3H95_11865 [Acidobacteria bacterium RIFCSPLOWO2_02_FULL_64_15]|nr:MAG: hypothetical protein A3H95_11865 [Acidobacteria bacterium RIFCSPLOWO2_02_FULL_64_15]
MLLPTAVFAQGGTLTGVVKDTSGAVLPGVTVQVASPALIERVRETVTDGTGQYRLVDLRPGTYAVTATLPGFNTFKREGIEVSGTGVFTINADLRVGAIEETVTVSGETPVVDLQSTTKERVMSKEVIDALPTGRMYYTLGVLVPGVNSSSRDVGGALGDTMGSLTAHGSTTGDQRVLQNGLNVMTLQTGGGNIGGSVPNTSAAQEVAIDSSAASAERQVGGVSINFIPRDGGNTIRGSLFATGATESQGASNFTQDLKNQGLTRVNRYKKNWDINPGVGGPILQDKLWYYYTYRNNGAQNYAAGMFYNQNEFLPLVHTYVPNANRPALSQHGDWWDSQIRLTWQMDPKNKFAGTWDQQYYCRCPNGVSATTSPEAANDRRFPVQQLMHGEWWSPLTSRILIEVVALHRTERWGNMELRTTDQGGSVDPRVFNPLTYQSMIGYTQTTGNAQGVPNGLQFHGPAGTFNNNWVPNYTYRWAVSYITGAHAFKVGGQDSFGFVTSTPHLPTLDALNRPVRYRLNNTGVNNDTPVFDQVTVWHTPWTFKNDQNHDLGLFVQDRWTLDRLTLNGGVRFDWYTSEVPGQTLTASTIGRPATHFPGILKTVDWKDVTPRAGASYDLQGDGKTAVKVTLNKYIAGQALGGLPGSANPIGRLTNSNSRTWADGNGNRVVDCDLMNTAKQPECTNTGNASFASGSTAIPGATAENPSGLTDFNVRRGWDKRSYNWEFSAGVQREIIPRVSVDVSFFRRWYGNFTATDNVAISPLTGLPIGPADFDSFSIVTPVDSRLPGGGGQRVSGYVDRKTTALATTTAVNRAVFTDDYGKRIDHWNGVDISVNARLQNGLLLQGGTSTGRRTQDDCEVSALLPETLGNNPQAFCNRTEPFRTQFKLVSAYTLPRYERLPATLGQVLQNIQVAGTFQSIPGNELLATYQMPNAEFANLAFSDLSTVNPAHGDGIGTVNISNASNKTVALIKPGTRYDKRQNQLDLRVGRILRFGRTRTTVNIDIFNVFNDNTVLGRSTAFTKAPGIGADNAVNNLWAPNNILQARFFKVSATFDF